MPVQLGPLKQRIVLGLLLCRPNRIVSVDAFCDALWSGTPPRTAHKNLQVYVSALRKALRGDTEQHALAGSEPEQVLVRRPPGYLIHVQAEQLDLLRFEELARGGRLAARNGDSTQAAHLLGTAVGMWRGPALSDLATVPALASEAEALEDRYLTVYEDWCQAELALGHHAQHVDDIDELARRHPYRERLRHAQMLALYQSGRQAEALAQFDAMRQDLVREMGMQPSPVLGRLYEAMLRGDDSLEPRAAARAKPVVIRSDHTQLPGDLADFTGRVADVRQLTAAVCGASSSHRGAVVSGLAGVGKTALAVHCAHQVGQHFPDGRVLVRMRNRQGRPRPAVDVLAELLRGVGVSGTLPRALDERAALYRTQLADRRMLVVLDGASDESQVRPMLPGAGESRVVVTCRRRLVGLEAVEHLDLQPMDEEEALDLLGRLIGPHRVAAEPVTARGLVATCGQLPLPIRIVGANLAALGHLTLAHYARRLADERQLLDEMVAGDLRMRPRLDSSYLDLLPPDRFALRRIGLLADSAFSLHDAAAALGTGLPQAEKAVERLIAAHLVVVRAWQSDAHDPCYRLPFPIRVYARERAREEQQPEERGGDPERERPGERGQRVGTPAQHPAVL
ncbi:BTAD domain-containing putative transcriptional regulator [Streptomyces sp. CA-111067]|uniref:AfsR/SARP family transcriptional regulator n=1 Tax=Streptomyces sp. CA-111067 TaxID=3240046 RepID=UPI003D96D70C